MEDIYNGRFYYFTWRKKRSHNFLIRWRYNYCKTLSANSDIGKPTVKKYTAAEGEIILGIAVNDPVTMTGGKRKTAILVLGHLFRLKLASGLSNIAVNDKIALTSTGAIKSDDGEYIAMHPVASSDDYKYIEVFRPYDIGTTGQT